MLQVHTLSVLCMHIQFFFKELEPFMMLFKCNKDEGGKKVAK